MVKIYTTPSCTSCRKAKIWLEEQGIHYVEIKLFEVKLSDAEVDLMLHHSSNGFEDILSVRSKVFKNQKKTLDDMSYNELKEFIKENPTVLKRPIILDKTKMEVGFNGENIRVFVPKERRQEDSN